MTTEKTIALTIQTFVGKVLSLLFNILSSFIIALLSKEQASLNFILSSLTTVILEYRKIKFVTASTFPHLFAMK